MFVYADGIMTALADLTAPDVEWGTVDIDGIVSRLEATFAEFMAEIRDAQAAV